MLRIQRTQGTWAVAKTLADNNKTCLSIVGGGDSASAAEKSGYAPQFSHISTGQSFIRFSVSTDFLWYFVSVGGDRGHNSLL